VVVAVLVVIQEMVVLAVVLVLDQTDLVAEAAAVVLLTLARAEAAVA
jgi:hypothetical protein